MYQLNQVPSEAQIKKYLRRIIFGKNIFCPECRSQKIVRYQDRYRCKKCRTKFSLISHTWLSGMKITYQKFWLVLWCWTSQIPVKQSMKLCGLSEEAVRRWFDRFRDNLPQNEAILERIVQLDEMYSKGLALIMGKEQGTRKLAYMFLRSNSVQKHNAVDFLKYHVKPRSKLRTDGAMIYKGIHEWWPVKHQVDIHRKFEFGYTSEIEGIFGNLRTFVRRMYHHATPEKMPEIVREFCFRFSLPEMFDSPLNYLEKSLMLVPFD